nr:hypothetical protein [Kibdelosporangium sp. MJ126-NF4]CEL18008.1 Short-chain dehydrogenase/reductase SDR [Kibdelosporangium sp. MJ126-NF4]CTQ90764.1 Short-chain dehydrogenase/reductase SDR [Kibdelosporangium sp. MJ126-NF4]
MEITDDEWRRYFEVNVLAAVQLPCAARELDCVGDLGVPGCHMAACNDHKVLLSLLYLIVRCLLGVPAVLLRRDVSKENSFVSGTGSLPRRSGKVDFVHVDTVFLNGSTR